MKFKIGDKVRGVKSTFSFPHPLPDFAGRDFTVTEVIPEDSSCAYRVSGGNWRNVLVFSWEIEKISKYAPNEQLLFELMY